MDFDLSDEQRLIRDTARRFSDRELAERARENDRNHHFDVELVQRIAGQGHLGAIDALRGHVADPEADHRPRRDGPERAGVS